MAKPPAPKGGGGPGKGPAWLRNADLLFTAGLFGIVSLLILPIPAWGMDFMLTLSIGVSLLILMIVIYIKDPPEFSVFPTILLAVTLLRLGLNIASTRLILLKGDAGAVIDSFGNFVVQGNYVVGAVVFLILVIINFVVITKGAGRIAEVSARFTLDAMPGKQMAIDAELNAGLIDEATARSRREAVTKEADFYGAMDGASKFVRGDAMAGILITLINVVGGISIGVFQGGLPINEALEKYTLLSIGDGLVSQVPALVVSVAAGILVTRSQEGSDLGNSLGKQITRYPRALVVAGVMLIVFALLPGMPFIPFASLGMLAVFAANQLKQHGIGEKSGSAASADEEEAAAAQLAGDGQPALPDGAEPVPLPGSPKDLAKDISVDVIAVELGYALVPLADEKKGGDLLDRITSVRKGFASEMGMILPSVAVRDNLELEPNDYRVLVRGRAVSSGMLLPNRWMAINPAGGGLQLDGVPTTEPAFGLDAMWVDDSGRREAEIAGSTVVDPTSVLITHLSELFKTFAGDILEREDTQKLLDLVKNENPTLISELLPDNATVGLIQRVLQNLLGERIPIKNLTVILETIADFAPFTKNPDELSEQVRRRLGTYFVSQFEAEPQKLIALTLEPMLEQNLIPRIKRSQFEIGLMMDPGLTDHIMKQLNPKMEQMAESGLLPVLLTTVELRLAFKRFFAPSFPRLNVLSYQELPNETAIETCGVITAPQNLQAPMTPPAAQPGGEAA